MSEDLENITRNEIAKRFVLPERQSKIKTLLRQDKVCFMCKLKHNSSTYISCEACEETYHTACIGLLEEEIKYIKQYFCLKCTSDNPTLKTKWNKNSPYHTEQRPRKRYRNENKTSAKLKKCGHCMGCNRTEDCGKCNVCTKHKLKTKQKRKKERCMQRICINYGEERHSSSDRETAPMAHLMTDYPRQCYGPACVQSARYGSKYCSDACGLKLAKDRLLQILPQRLQEWNLTPSVAEKNNISTLEQVRKEKAAVSQKLQELDEKERELNTIIEKGKTLTIDENFENDHEEESDSMYCVTCGYEIHSKTAIKHMEKCFNKYESQTSFGSIYECKIEGNTMFCDFYNSTNKTYCKKLRVLCPEHCKDPKIGDDEVCGCPLTVDVCTVSETLCRAPKKLCPKHYVWEKLRRAEIDLGRIRLWLKIDELFEKERNIRAAMANRAGVLGLMLHSTYNHEVMDQVKKSSS